MIRGQIEYRLSRPDGASLRLDAWDGERQVVRGAEVRISGRTPAQVATAFHACAQRHLLLSRRWRIVADWPLGEGVGTTLWQGLRDAVAGLPRGG